jgi:hypothetical protein
VTHSAANKNRRLNRGDFGELFAPPLLRLNKSRENGLHSALRGAVGCRLIRTGVGRAIRIFLLRRRLQFDKLDVVEMAVARRATDHQKCTGLRCGDELVKESRLG